MVGALKSRARKRQEVGRDSRRGRGAVGTKKERGCRGRAGVGARGSIDMLGIRDGVGGGGCGVV